MPGRLPPKGRTTGRPPVPPRALRESAAPASGPRARLPLRLRPAAATPLRPRQGARRGPGGFPVGRGPSILGIGTALPPAVLDQAVAAETVIRHAGLDGVAADWARRLFSRSGVRCRRTVLEEFAAGRAPFGGGLRPGTAARMGIYRRHAGPLAAEASARALAASGVAPAEVTHVVGVTCTGSRAPGLDVDLAGRLGLRNDVDRIQVGFMGCHGAFAGLRSARRAVLAEPGAVVLVACVELCSLHVRDDPSPEALVAFSLFGDGAAAAVVAAGRPAASVLLDLGTAASALEPGTDGMMRWDVGNDGFELGLSAEVPDRIGAAVGAFARRLGAAAEVESWCVHPGGPAILAAAEGALGLGPEALAASRAVLAEVGNVSSATILFVLDREAARIREGARGMALGFGPGLTMEGFAFRRGGAPARPSGVAARSADAAR